MHRKDGRFSGWPANNGIWSWGDEIVVGFTVGYMDLEQSGHPIDRKRPNNHWQARSVDGGHTWSLEKPEALEQTDPSLFTDLQEPMDFTHPDFAITLRMSGLSAGAASWFYYSTDRCKTWNGPFRFPMLELPGIAARTDCVVYGKHEALLGLTAAKSDGKEGRTFCARTTDGGVSWEFVSWIGPEPKGYAIMPSTVRLPSGRLITAIRRREALRQEGPRTWWIENYVSDDDGKTWNYLNTPAPDMSGNPASLIQLQDGRLCMTYANRHAPFSIHARLSEDEGNTWSDPIVVREGAGNWDIGYPRTMQRPDGALVTAYYWNDSPETERYIAATIWRL